MKRGDRCCALGPAEVHMEVQPLHPRYLPGLTGGDLRPCPGACLGSKRGGSTGVPSALLGLTWGGSTAATGHKLGLVGGLTGVHGALPGLAVGIHRRTQ